MKLVAAARLRRAQDALIAARPYAAAITEVVSELAAGAGTDAHPLFEERPRAKACDRRRSRAIAAWPARSTRTSSRPSSATRRTSCRARPRSRCGSSAARAASTSRAAARRSTSFDPAPTGATALEVARETANRVIDDFTSGKVDRVFVVYNEFKSAISQIVARRAAPAGRARDVDGRSGRPRRDGEAATSSTSRASRRCSTGSCRSTSQIELYRARARVDRVGASARA